MSSVDIQAIEEAMRAQQLDQLRGYKQDTYGTVRQIRDNAYVTDVAKHLAVGQQVLREPTFNKGRSAPEIHHSGPIKLITYPQVLHLPLRSVSSRT